jgi:hypothetical protein
MPVIVLFREGLRTFTVFRMILRQGSIATSRLTRDFERRTFAQKLQEFVIFTASTDVIECVAQFRIGVLLADGFDGGDCNDRLWALRFPNRHNDAVSRSLCCLARFSERNLSARRLCTPENQKVSGQDVNILALPAAR